MSDLAADLDRFYELLGVLALRVGGPRLLSECDGRSGWPQRGVYFFFEPGEIRRNGTPRVVRVGTHALVAGSRSTLWGRLSQHRGQIGGSAPGGGNHRGSIFRLLVGAALLRRDAGLAADPAQASWGHGSSAGAAVRDLELTHERRVSTHIRAMPFLWLPVSDPPGPTSDRELIEAGAIALLSALSNPYADPPSSTWLGLHSDREKVVGSGLWNVNHVLDAPGEHTLDLIDRWITMTSRVSDSQPRPSNGPG